MNALDDPDQRRPVPPQPGLPQRRGQPHPVFGMMSGARRLGSGWAANDNRPALGWWLRQRGPWILLVAVSLGIALVPLLR